MNTNENSPPWVQGLATRETIQAFSERRSVLVAQAASPDLLMSIAQAPEFSGVVQNTAPAAHLSQRISLPCELDFEADVRAPLTRLVGNGSDELTCCEMRMLAFENNAESVKPPPRDHRHDVLTVLIPISLSRNTRVTLKAQDSDETEIGDIGPDWTVSWPRRGADLTRLLVRAGRDGKALSLNPGDALIFDAARLQPDFSNPGDSVFLRMCFNRNGHDPLADDPNTGPMCLNSFALESEIRDAELTDMEIRRSPRLCRLQRDRNGNEGSHRFQAVRNEKVAISLSAPEYRLLSRLEHPTRVARIDLEDCGVDDTLPLVRNLIRLGLVVFTRHSQTSHYLSQLAA